MKRFLFLFLLVPLIGNAQMVLRQPFFTDTTTTTAPTGYSDTLYLDYGATAVSGWTQINSGSVSLGDYTIATSSTSATASGNAHTTYPTGVGEDAFYKLDSIYTTISGLTASAVDLEVYVSRSDVSQNVTIYTNYVSQGTIVNIGTNTTSLIISDVPVVSGAIRITAIASTSNAYINAIVMYLEE